MAKDGVAEALAGYGEGHDRKPIGENVAGQVYAGPVGQNGPYLTPRHSADGSPPPQTQGVKRPMLAERLGARYAISVPMLQQNSPESQLTQANGIVIKSAVNRSEPNFQSGAADSTGR